MQVGLDGLFFDNANGALVAGFTAHYRTGEAKIASRYGDSKIHPDGFGGTPTWFGANGFYADAQAALTWYSSALKADDLPLSPSAQGLRWKRKAPRQPAPSRFGFERQFSGHRPVRCIPATQPKVIFSF